MSIKVKNQAELAKAFREHGVPSEANAPMVGVVTVDRTGEIDIETENEIFDEIMSLFTYGALFIILDY